MIELLPESRENVLSIRATGKLSGADYRDVLAPQVRLLLKQFRALRVLFVMDNSFAGWSLGAAWANTVLDLRHRRDFEKIAMVGAPILSRGGTPVEVTSVAVAAIGTGQTGATFRVSAKYVTNPYRLPDTFVIKLPAQDDTVRDRVTIGYRSQCAFYASVADRVRVPTPQCFHCEIAEDARAYALLLADQAPAIQADQISALGFAFATVTDRGDDMVLTMLGRGCQTIRDLGTLDLVGPGCA